MTIPVLFPACGKTSRLDGFGRRSRHDSRGQVLAARPVPLKVEYLTFSVTGPYWKITTETGRSGSSAAKRLPGWTSGARETNSVLSKQVWSNHSREPCVAGSFAASHCLMAYRWYLDYVVDVHGNSASWWYDGFSNLHGANAWGATVKPEPVRTRPTRRSRTVTVVGAAHIGRAGHRAAPRPAARHRHRPVRRRA